MVKVRIVQRKSPVLAPSTLACLSNMPTVNLTMGCAHGCLYCYTRGYRAYPGEGKVNVYGNLVEKMLSELGRRRHKPRAVYFSPASDLFQPLPETRELAYRVLEELLRREIGVAFLTKGVIPEEHMSLLQKNAALVRAQIGLITLDEPLLHALEPNAATAAVRIAQLKRLSESGIRTQIRVDPIMPELTDDPATFEELCSAASSAGVKDAAASALFLRPAPVQRLRQEAQTNPAIARCLAAFSNAQRIAIHAKRSSVTALSAGERELIFQRFESVAARYGITVRRCACKNPDIATGSCSIAGEWRHKHAESSRTLFDEAEDV